ncbi:hypothetical protein [Actinomadura rifamycini]|uniref:hypothetical protein n=1 Tax=Actinomadura rifamycini TaxID=31962 RepID=UPI000406719C|nr:hypothetical protein [Actinomadura rifamycini]
MADDRNGPARFRRPAAAASVAGSQLAGRPATARGPRTAMLASLAAGGAGALVLGASLGTVHRRQVVGPGARWR